MSPASPDAAAPAWRPLLTDDLAAQALESAQEIAADLRRLAASTDPVEALPLNRMRFSLAGGLAGQALFFAYLDRACPGRGYDETAVELVEGAFEELARADAPPSLFSGFDGVAWIAEHLRGWLIDEEEEDSGLEVATVLSRLLSDSPWHRELDLVSGLVGHGVFALERLPRLLGVECLEKVVTRLGEVSERGPQGISWWTAPTRMTARGREENPEGVYDLGIAHGIPGVIALLGRACARGVAASESRLLLEGAVAWLLDHQNPAGSSSRFPTKLAPGRDNSRSRVAWCYGDLGIAAALLVAARGANEPEWERTALDLARGAAGRSFEESGVIDAALCHGAAGNAHLFNRLFQATGDPVLGDAARTWAERALAMRCPGAGIGGYLSWVPDSSFERDWRKDPSLLTGAAGIGLALVAAATPVEPAWDRALLISASRPERPPPDDPAAPARAPGPRGPASPVSSA